MGLIPQTKCGRCDRYYSSLRSRCPYCGAHRHKKGKRTTDSDNATWKIIIGILLIVVLIAAVVVILVTSAGEKDKTNDNTGDDINNADDGTVSGGNQGDDGGTTLPDDGSQTGGTTGGDLTNPDGTTPGTDLTNPGGTTVPGQDGTQTGIDDIPVQVIATSISARTRYQKQATDFSLNIGDTIEVTAIVTPSNATSMPTWTSEDDSVLSVVPDETGMKATLTCLGTGSIDVTVSVDSLDYTFVVRCRK